MKKFTFPLARVLDWRRTQVQIEETKLERLHAESRAIETRLQQTQLAREESGRALIAAGSATGAELAALDSFRKASDRECVKLAESAAASRRRAAEQMQVVISRRRAVKLLEHLHHTRFDHWSKELTRELDREASELHLFKSRAR